MFDKELFETKTENGLSTMMYTDKKAYTSGTEIPKKVLKEVDEYNRQYVSEFVAIAKDLALDHLKKNKDVKEVNIEVPYTTSGHGSITVNVDREKKYPNLREVGGEPLRRSSLNVKVKDPFCKIKSDTLTEYKRELTQALID